jgi:hypothetical protein
MPKPRTRALPARTTLAAWMNRVALPSLALALLVCAVDVWAQTSDVTEYYIPPNTCSPRAYFCMAHDGVVGASTEQVCTAFGEIHQAHNNEFADGANVLPYGFDGAYCVTVNRNRVARLYSRTVPNPLVIELAGPSATKALPAGPELPQTARVTRSGVPVAGVEIQIRINGVQTAAANSDARGESRFTYVPPVMRSTLDNLSATCTGCSNTVNKLIDVQACDVCGH